MCKELVGNRELKQTLDFHYKQMTSLELGEQSGSRLDATGPETKDSGQNLFFLFPKFFFEYFISRCFLLWHFSFFLFVFCSKSFSFLV